MTTINTHTLNPHILSHYLEQLQEETDPAALLRRAMQALASGQSADALPAELKGVLDDVLKDGTLDEADLDQLAAAGVQVPASLANLTGEEGLDLSPAPFSDLGLDIVTDVEDVDFSTLSTADMILALYILVTEGYKKQQQMQMQVVTDLSSGKNELQSKYTTLLSGDTSDPAWQDSWGDPNADKASSDYDQYMRTKEQMKMELNDQETDLSTETMKLKQLLDELTNWQAMARGMLDIQNQSDRDAARSIKAG